MTRQPASQPLARENSIIPARRECVTILCIHAFLAILAALGLRLLFVFWFPGSSDDSEMYLQLARNWADHHVYGFALNGQIFPTDLRTPGYPAFLAGVATLLGRSMQAILLSQAALDVLTCFLTAALAAWLAPAGARRRVWIIALWLAATCPFLANYSAVVLTEVLVTFLTTAALCCFILGLGRRTEKLNFRDESGHLTLFACALLGAFITGMASLVRPEMPLLLGVGGFVYALRAGRALGARKAIVLIAAMAGAFLLPLLPWAARNFITLRKVQFIAPRYANLPGEYAPVGFYSWTATWLERYRDVYFTVWKVGEPDEPLIVDELPPAAFDSPEEKARVADLFSEYNSSPDLEISPELDVKFAEIARERTRRHPLRTLVSVPFQRALTIWFTPRTELLPIDGKFWPVREQWEDSHADVLVTAGFAVLGYLYVALAVGGVWVAWRARGGTRAIRSPRGPNLWGIVLLLAYFLVRTGFLTTVEAPEPRYVVSCFPGVLALISLIAIRKVNFGESGGPV
jgi:4-amino-4-deoxy-L-arabinose transferase-like glycosyltransferase